MTSVSDRTVSGSPSVESPSRPSVHILADRCAGCQECIVRCPTAALSLDTDQWVAVVDQDLCVGCGQCQRSCPFAAIFVEGPQMVTAGVLPIDLYPTELVGSIHEVRQGFESMEDVMAEASRCISCPDPTCVRGCPAHNDIPGFISALLEGDLQGAREILSLTSCMPGACSRVCDWQSQCEGSCTWSLSGGRGVAVGRIERFIADAVPAVELEPKRSTDLKIAVVGAGPGGIGAAYELFRSGAKVTVFDSEAEPGGVLRWGIPAYVLPNSAWQPTVAQLLDAGVEFRLASPVSPEDVPKLLDSFDGVVIAAGATSAIVPKISGVEMAGVVDATTFLESAKEQLIDGTSVTSMTGKHVLVLGAGNTAMDVARSVLRLGGVATCVDWMDERFSRARPDEIREARHEGVRVDFCTTVTQLIEVDGVVGRAVLNATQQNEASQIPKLIAGKVTEVDVDMVVLAMGYRLDPGWTKISKQVDFGRLPQVVGIPDRRWMASGMYAGSEKLASLALTRERVRLDSAFQVADRIWSVGDVRIGPSTVVTAMAQGMSAARGVVAEIGTTADGPVDHAYTSSPKLRTAVVIYESAGGNTKKAATVVAQSLSTRGFDARAISTTVAKSSDLLDADLIVFGTWVEGLLLAKVHPAEKATRYIGTLPPLNGKDVACFVTFGLNPKQSAGELSEAFARLGANVLASAAISSKHLISGAQAFARSVQGAAKQ